MIESKSLDSVAWQPTPLGGRSRMLRNVPELRLVNLLLACGEEVASHLAPVEVVFVVRNGRGTIVVDGTSQLVSKDSYLVCPRDRERSILADQGEDLDLLVIRCPNL